LDRTTVSSSAEPSISDTHHDSRDSQCIRACRSGATLLSARMDAFLVSRIKDGLARFSGSQARWDCPNASVSTPAIIQITHTGNASSTVAHYRTNVRPRRHHRDKTSPCLWHAMISKRRCDIIRAVTKHAFTHHVKGSAITLVLRMIDGRPGRLSLNFLPRAVVKTCTFLSHVTAG
jgi:hypothetical protein